MKDVRRMVQPGTLYVVATPIGNLGDLTRRAEETLKSVQIVAAEDTRRTRVLLDHIGQTNARLLSYHEHSDTKVVQTLLQALLSGEDVALVSDAGTPLLNDPGFPLVRAAWEAGVHVSPVPGPSALTAVVSICPLAMQPFQFVGFLPSKSGQRRALLRTYVSEPQATVFMEAPHRIRATVQELAALTQRRIFVARELTKRFETVLFGTAEEVLTRLDDAPKGEFIGIIEAARASDASHDTRRLLTALLKELSPSRAARVAADITGERRAEMYDLALELGKR